MKFGDMPKPASPVRVPNADDPDVLDARRKKMLDEMANKDGRASTNLSGNSPSYNRTTLG